MTLRAAAEQALKPCPFCGSEPYSCRHLSYSNWGVTCLCGATGPTKNAGYRPLREAEIRAHNDAVAAWNERAALAAEQPQQRDVRLIKGAWIDGGYVIATPASGVPARTVLDAVTRLAEQPQPEAPMQQPRIDPMQNPMRPTLTKLGPADEHPAESVLRKLACWLGVGGYNAPTVDAEVFHRVIVDGIEYLVRERAAPSAPRDAVSQFACGVDAAARLVEQRLADYDAEHGSTDSDTGAREYPGTGDEYVCELDEIAEAIRGLAPPAAQSEQDVDDAMVERACIAYSEATYGQCTETRREAMIRSGAMHAALLAALGGQR